jgi:hypothetical protein
MKKIFGLTAVLFVAFAIETYAIGIGLQAGGSALRGGELGFNDPGLSLLVSPNEQVHGAITWYAGTGGLSLGASLDYWFLEIDIISLGPGDLRFFVGGGAYAGIAIWEDYLGLGAGLRLPVGVDWKLDFLDVFVQLVPRAGISVLPSLGFDRLYVDVNVGGRFWIG